MKIEYNGFDLGDILSESITTAEGAYDHDFTYPKLRWRIRIRNWLGRLIFMWRAGFGLVLTKKKANKIVIKMLTEKENNQ